MTHYHGVRYDTLKCLKCSVLTSFSLVLNFVNLFLRRIPFVLEFSRERLEYALIFFWGLWSLVAGLMRYSVDTRESFFSNSIWCWRFVSMRLNNIETWISVWGKPCIFWNHYKNKINSCMTTIYLHCSHNYALIFWRKN